MGLLGGPAWGQAPGEPVDPPLSDEPTREPVEDATALSPYRTRFDLLAGRTIGTASQPVAFDWRKSRVQVAGIGGYVAELNNFNSMRAGGVVRVPNGRTLLELGLTYAGTWDSPSSKTLALTPYRQPARPNRLELDVGLGLPLAEGVVTAVPRFFPAVQLVFSGYVGVRYLSYPWALGGMRPGQVARALLSPSLTDTELENLEEARLPAMQIDRGRMTTLVGLGNDIYFGSGLFLSPRLMLAVPLLAPASQTELYVWADLQLLVGIAL